MGKPQVAIYAFLPALVINFIANMFLIPVYGGTGAAWATNISYFAGSVAYLFAYSSITRMPVSEIFKYRRSDFYFMKDLKILRLWKKEAPPAGSGKIS